MNFRKVTAIFPGVDLDNVEQALIGVGDSGMTLSTTHGFGEYRNYYARDNHDRLRSRKDIHASRTGG